MVSNTPDKTNTVTHRMTGKCPFGGDSVGGTFGTPPTLENWYPARLRVELLHQNGLAVDPLGPDFDCAAEFAKLDFEALKRDIEQFLTTSVDWGPSDHHNHGPQMIRMAWHAAGTHRIADGRGGAGTAMQRFAPVSSGWDNGNTDKSRRLIQPLKHKHGIAISWGDLMVLTGNCALEIMGPPTYGYADGRLDAWGADNASHWGPEIRDPKNVDGFDSMVMRDQRWRGQNGDADDDLQNPLAASHQALIYVNPEGPYAHGDPLGSARDIRVTFTRMAMNDEETVALIAGGHAFGKSHGMTPPEQIGPPPEIAPLEAMGLGWHNPRGTGAGADTMTNGIEGGWTPDPTKWDNSHLENLFKFEWKQVKSPAGASRWTPVDPNAPKTPGAHIPGRMNPLMMMTRDIALKMGQEPLPDREGTLPGEADIAALKQAVPASGLSVSDLAFTAFSSAAPCRDSDKRSGADGARIALAPQKDWAVNRRAAPVVAKLRGVMADFNGRQGGAKVSLADLIVLAGCAAVARAAKDAGVDVQVPFTPGRVDTTQELTDIEMFEWLRPVVEVWDKVAMLDRYDVKGHRRHGVMAA